MINFGASTITWESVNLLTNGSLDSWTTGNNSTPSNWTLQGSGNYFVAHETNKTYEGIYSAKLMSGNNTNNYAYFTQYIQNNKGMNYWKNRTVRLSGYVFSNIANVASLILNDNNSTLRNNHTGSSTWEYLQISSVISQNANFISIYPYVTCYNNTTTIGYYDSLSIVEGPYTLGKTFGGGSINLQEIKTTGMKTKNETSIITGGEGVLHLFQWNNTIAISNNSIIYDYGKVTITNNQMTIILDCCSFYFSGSMPFGEFKQSPLDLYFTFKKSPDTGNIITII